MWIFEFFSFACLTLTAGIEHHLQDFFGIRERLSSSWCGMMNEWIFSVNGRNVRRSSRPFQCWKILLHCHFTRRHSVFHSPRTSEFLNHLCHPTKVRRGEEENTTNLTPFGLYYSFSSKPPTTSPSNRPQHQIAHKKHILKRERKKWNIKWNLQPLTLHRPENIIKMWNFSLSPAYLRLSSFWPILHCCYDANVKAKHMFAFVFNIMHTYFFVYFFILHAIDSHSFGSVLICNQHCLAT